MKPHQQISWHRVRNFAAVVRSPAPVRSAFIGHPVLRGWWKCVLSLHGKPVVVCLSPAQHWDCVAEGFRFYGWLYRIVALTLAAMAVWAGANGLAGLYWLGFVVMGAVCLWCATGLAFAGAKVLPRCAEDGICKLVVFLFFVGLFLVATLAAISAQAKTAELLPDAANLVVTILLMAFGVGSYLVEVMALLTARGPVHTQG